MEVLHALSEHAPQAIRLGSEASVLASAGRLALEIAAQGRAVPVLERDGEGWTARWRPIPEGALPVHLEALVEALPTAGRAGAEAGVWPSWRANAQEKGWGAVPAPSASAVIYDLVWTLTDALVRGLLSSKAPMSVPSSGPAQARALAAWLKALQSPDPRLDPSHDKVLRALQKTLEPWTDRAAQRGPERIRVCFRLSAPEEGGQGWLLEFLCQDRQDPSVLIPIEAAWRRGPSANVLRRLIESPQEALVKEMERAAGLVPELADALEKSRVRSLTFDVDGAHRFLRESAPLLERVGFGVLTPSWWKKPTRPGLKAIARGEGKTGEGLGDIFEFDWQVALGDEVLDEATLRELARIKAPLVRFRGQWIELRAEDLDKVLAFIERHGDESLRLTAPEVMRLGAGLDAIEGLPVHHIEARGALGELLKGEAHQLRIRKAPRDFIGKLRPYQTRGLSWLAFLEGLGLGACLADDMGLGKTVQVLARLEHERAGEKRGERLSPGPTLLVCPMSVVGNWAREAARFAPKLDVAIHHGPDRLDGEAFRARAEGADMVITTYTTAARDIERLGLVRWHRAVLDEAQNIKNADTKQARALKTLGVRHRVALTGTPVENRLSELWSIMDFLNPGLLGSAKGFRDALARPIELYKDAGKAAQLRHLCGPFVLRRLKTDKKIIKDLPDKIEIKEYCPMTREQVSLYQAVAEASLEAIDASEGIERKGRVLSAMTRLKQVCDHPALLLADGSALPGRSGKLSRLEELIEDIVGAGEKVLVFTQYAQMGKMLVRHITERLDVGVLFLHGQASRKAREQMMAQFQEPDGPPVFLISLKAGGTGLTLTAANHVIHYDRWWNPAVEDQATDRAFRIGQRRDVQVRKFICPGTLEARIDAMIDDKRALAAQVVGAGEAGLTELSTEDLREIFALSGGLVVD